MKLTIEITAPRFFRDVLTATQKVAPKVIELLMMQASERASERQREQAARAERREARHRERREDRRRHASSDN